MASIGTTRCRDVTWMPWVSNHRSLHCFFRAYPDQHLRNIKSLYYRSFENHQRPMESLRKGPVMWKMFPCYDVFMITGQTNMRMAMATNTLFGMKRPEGGIGNFSQQSMDQPGSTLETLINFFFSFLDDKDTIHLLGALIQNNILKSKHIFQSVKFASKHGQVFYLFFL